MLREDVTPTPVIVTTESRPDSSGSYPVTVPHEGPNKRVDKSRGLLRKLIIAPAAVLAGATAFVAPSAIGELQNREANTVNAALDRLEKMDHPKILEEAQGSASYRLYPNDKNRQDLTKKAADTSVSQRTLDVRGFVPDVIETEGDGWYFKVDGADYGLTLRETAEGHAIVAASRVHMGEGLFIKDGGRYSANRLVVGAAKDIPSSDRDGDGVVTPQEVQETALLHAKTNLANSLSPATYLVINESEDLNR